MFRRLWGKQAWAFFCFAGCGETGLGAFLFRRLRGNRLGRILFRKLARGVFPAKSLLLKKHGPNKTNKTTKMEYSRILAMTRGWLTHGNPVQRTIFYVGVDVAKAWVVIERASENNRELRQELRLAALPGGLDEVSSTVEFDMLSACRREIARPAVRRLIPLHEFFPEDERNRFVHAIPLIVKKSMGREFKINRECLRLPMPGDMLKWLRGAGVEWTREVRVGEEWKSPKDFASLVAFHAESVFPEHVTARVDEASKKIVPTKVSRKPDDALFDPAEYDLMMSMKNAYFHRLLSRETVDEAVEAYKEPKDQLVYAKRVFTCSILEGCYNQAMNPLPPTADIVNARRAERGREATLEFKDPSSPSWITNDIIDVFYGSLLVKLGETGNETLSLELTGAEKPLSRLASGLMLNSVEIELLTDGRHDKLREIRRRIEKRNGKRPVEYIVCRVNKGNAHWVCCKIDKVSDESTVVTYVDSYGKEPEVYHLSVFKDLAESLAPGVPVTVVHCPIRGQLDGWSCALHTMWNLLCLIHGFEKTLAFPYWISIGHDNMLGVKERLLSDFARVLTTEWNP